MAIADRYEGLHAGVCACGAELIWARNAEGQWVTQHVKSPEQEPVAAAG